MLLSRYSWVPWPVATVAFLVTLVWSFIDDDLDKLLPTPANGPG